MESSNNKYVVHPELIAYYKKSDARFSKRLEESRLAHEAQLAKEKAELDARLAKERAELAAKIAANEAEAKKRQEEFDLQKKESDLRHKKMSEDLDKLKESVNAHIKNTSLIAEERFYVSLCNSDLMFFGEKFDTIERNVKYSKKGLNFEFDIVVENGTKVLLLETKYKAHVNDIEQILKKAEQFRRAFPEYANYEIYLGLASMAFYDELEQRCIKEGIAIFKAIDDTLIVTDENLKTF
jgi:hypothetical protein